jgi:predicted HicB family RNase H-like nuclease
MRGGKREGAGRKAEGRSAVLYARVQPRIAERIKAESQAQGISIGEVIEQYISRGEV